MTTGVKDSKNVEKKEAPGTNGIPGSAEKAATPEPPASSEKIGEKTFNQADLDAAKAEGKKETFTELNPKLSANGQEIARLKPFEARVTGLEEQLTTLLEGQDSRALEGARGDSERLTVVQERIKNRQDREKLNKDLITFEQDKAIWVPQLERLHKMEHTELAGEVATEHKVEAKDIIEAVPFNLKTPAEESKKTMETVAKMLAKVAGAGSEGDGGDGKPPAGAKQQVREGGQGQGGEGQLTGPEGARAMIDKAKAKAKGESE